jgi:hypothetical protein
MITTPKHPNISTNDAPPLIPFGCSDSIKIIIVSFIEKYSKILHLKSGDFE